MRSCVDLNADAVNSRVSRKASAHALLKRLLSAATVFLPAWPAPNTSTTFPTPVTPIARDTLNIHNEFMLIITVLFVVVFAIMIYSMIKHRKSVGHQPANFTGPTGSLQWFWALVPFAILLFIDFVLMGIPAYHAVIEMEDTKTKADMVLKVTGMQWKWQYEYPDSGIKFISTSYDAARSDRQQGEPRASTICSRSTTRWCCRSARRCACC